MKEVILTIHNNQCAACGLPPQLENGDKRYYGYFENEWQEQFLFVFDFETSKGTLFCGDAGWQEKYDVVNGIAVGLEMGTENGCERLWLQGCWLAATLYGKRLHHTP